MAFDTYMQINTGASPDPVGEATATFVPAMPGAFEIFSFSWGASNPTTVGTTGSGLSAGKVSVSSFNIMKKSDKASPVLFSACCVGQHYAKAIVVCRKAAGTAGKQSIFLQYDFKDVMIESIQWSGSSGGDDTPTESVSFAFGVVNITYNLQDTVTGAVSKGSSASWDLTKAVVS
jgi:type VI secretion system secreted protein Hcp